MQCRRLLWGSCLCIGLVAPCWASEPSSVKEFLARPIIEADLPMKEVQDYTEGRVPPMPQVSTTDEWKRHAQRIRQDVLDNVVFRGKAKEWRTAQTRVKWLETIEGGPEYHIRKLRYEALPGLWIPALLYEPKELHGKVPVVLNVNGHDGKGKAADYKQIRCINQAKRGMLALNVEWLGMGQLRSDNFYHYRMNQIDLCGTSGLAPYYLSMKRGLDILLSHDHADSQRVAVAGLSGGGWQTIFISSLDTRVTLSNPVAGYSSYRTRARHLSDLGDSEQTPVDLATVADYTHLTALRAPRPTLLTFNAQDNCCFKADHALPPLMAAAKPIFQLYEKEMHLRSHVNHDPGTHNFEIDNRQALYRMFRDFFYADADFSAKEIPCKDEVKTAEELHVDLPEENRDFHTLALSLSRDLPTHSRLPQEKEKALHWQKQRREKLKQIVRAKQYDVQAHPVSEEKNRNTTARFWKLRLSNTWTVPVVEMFRGSADAPSSTVILVADEGRKSTALETERLLQSGRRVLAVDPFYFGESKIAKRDFLFALLVSAIGDRPLGLQASQLVAVANWAKNRHADEAVEIVAVGPRSSLFSLVAAALEPKAVDGLKLRNSYTSLKQVLEQNLAVKNAPELFCFGLLKEFDIRHLTALVAPRPVHFAGDSKGAEENLKGLKSWYGLLGNEFQPVSR